MKVVSRCSMSVRRLFCALVLGASLSSLIVYILVERSLVTRLLNTQGRLSNQEIQRLMQMSDDVMDPLAEQYTLREDMLHFYHLPKRKAQVLFNEITSANRDPSYPLAPDFTVHIDYGADSVVIYEDYGPGCVFRIYLFPQLPREVSTLHKLTASDLKNKYLHLNLDGEIFRYSLQHMLEGKEFPFLFPMSATHAYPASGLGAYLPICYNKHLRITYIHDEPLPKRLMHTTVNCSANDFICPTHIYAGVSRHKYPSGTQVASFAKSDLTHRKQFEETMRSYSEALKKPEGKGPAKGHDCNLKCVPLCASCKLEIFHATSDGVITAVRMRVYQTTFGHPRLLPDWDNILLTARFDENTPQISGLPLGWMFGVAGSLNGMSGVAMGHARQQCSFDMDSDLDNDHSFVQEDMTGYFYFPMPYWTSASFTIEGRQDASDKTLVCYQFIRTDNHYSRESTGYLHADERYYDGDVTGYRSMLQLNNTWGHVVATLLRLDNIRATRNVPLNERWALLQADTVLYVDHRREPAMVGTGVEDYFSYAHGFALAENTSYAFVGNHHAAPRRKEPLTYHCYRLHVLDPIPFQSQIHYLVEGTNRYNHTRPLPDISYQRYLQLLKKDMTTQGHVTLYYGRSLRPQVNVIDSLLFHDKHSLAKHNFSANSLRLGSAFSRERVKYWGQVTSNKTFSISGRQYSQGDKIQFILRYSRFSTFNTLVLRRRFYTAAFSWNQRAKVWVNEVFYGQWFSPMGTFNEQYSLREHDLVLNDLGPDPGGIVKDLRIEIEPETDWNDVAYELVGWR